MRIAVAGIARKLSPSGEKRIVRYRDLRPCFDAFIDTRTPGSDQKENFTIIGPGVSENPNQYVHITEPHGFNIGGARQPPGCVNSQHSHETVEVFFVHKGTWSFKLGEDGEDAKITLKPGDLISIPTHVFRGFENIGQDIGYLWAILGKDDPGRVLWAPKVFEMAKDYGLVLLENGNLIDTNKGETIPEGVNVMPVTNQDQISALQCFSEEQLRQCCILNDDVVEHTSIDGYTVKALIGSETSLNWPHGFTVDLITMRSSIKLEKEIYDVSDVIFVHEGLLDIYVNNEKWELSSGDTATIPRGATRYFSNNRQKDVIFLRVLGMK